MRPILLGMNPNGPDGSPALDPGKEGSAGYRLWKLSGLPLEVYLAAFDRRNLLPGPAWDDRAAVRKAKSFLGSLSRDQTVIVLGEAPRRALEKAGTLGPNFHFIPHPSGRCRTYNDRNKRLEVGRLLRELAAKAGARRR